MANDNRYNQGSKVKRSAIFPHIKTTLTIYLLKKTKIKPFFLKRCDIFH